MWPSIVELRKTAAWGLGCACFLIATLGPVGGDVRGARASEVPPDILRSAPSPAPSPVTPAVPAAPTPGAGGTPAVPLAVIPHPPPPVPGSPPPIAEPRAEPPVAEPLSVPAASRPAARQTPTRSATAQPVRVPPDVCARAVRHQPDADATYRGGVDVRGRPVAGADLQDWSAWTGGVDRGVVLPLVINPFAGQGEPPAGAAWLQTPGVPVGVVTVDTATGRLTLNGRPLDTDEAAQVAAACRARARGRR